MAVFSFNYFVFAYFLFYFIFYFWRGKGSVASRVINHTIIIYLNTIMNLSKVSEKSTLFGRMGPMLKLLLGINQSPLLGFRWIHAVFYFYFLKNFSTIDNSFNLTSLHSSVVPLTLQSPEKKFLLQFSVNIVSYLRIRFGRANPLIGRDLL
jgi:hypothetical protein